MPPLPIPSKLYPLATKKKRFKIVYGGRGGGKSQSFASLLSVDAQVNGSKVGCFREYQNSIEDSVHALLVSEIDRLQVPGYEIQKRAIENTSGGGFRFMGLSRSPGSVKSMFGFKKFWIEEAQFLTAESLKLLTPTLREDDAECWFSLNLMSSADPVSQRFIEPFRGLGLDRDGYYEDDLHLIIRINYDDNPWFPAGMEAERQFDLKNLPRAEYDHIWLGSYNDTVEGSIIPAEWFDAAVDAHKVLGIRPKGKIICSHDPSDEGNDAKATVVRHGGVVLHAASLGRGDAGDGMDWAIDIAVQHRADLFTWDCDGLGVSLKRQVVEGLTGKKIDWEMFKGSEGADHPDAIYEPSDKALGTNQQRTNSQIFRNKRAQYYWQLRDRFYNTYRAIVKKEYADPDKMISISSEIPELIALKSEVCRIPKKHNGNGMIQIMSKEDMRRMRIKSPNLADALMMSMYVPEEKPKWAPIKYSNKGIV